MQTVAPGSSSPAGSAEPVPAPPDPPAPPAAEFLTKELDLLCALYAQAESGLQNMFNFYMALVTTVSGAIVVLLQLAAASPDGQRPAQLGICALLVLAALIGSIYLSSISGKYAHMARYASAIDELRRHLLAAWRVTPPPLYAPLLAARPSAPARPSLWYLLPTGTYGFFLALLNTCALCAAMLVFLRLQGLAARPLLAPLLLLGLLIYTVYNIYSHMVIAAIRRRLTVQVYTHDSAKLIAGRQ